MAAGSTPVVMLLQQATKQVRENSRLRFGLWLVLGIVWLYALLVAGDWTDERARTTKELQDRARQMRPLRQGTTWSNRERDAGEALQRLRALSWQGAERGLIEANVQDWLRALAAKSGLGLRDLRMLSDAVGETPPAASSPRGRANAAAAPMRVRMVVDFQRVQALSLLAELGRQEPLIGVEHLIIHANAQPPAMELELRAMAWVGEVAQ